MYGWRKPQITNCDLVSILQQLVRMKSSPYTWIIIGKFCGSHASVTFSVPAWFIELEVWPRVRISGKKVLLRQIYGKVCLFQWGSPRPALRLFRNKTDRRQSRYTDRHGIFFYHVCCQVIFPWSQKKQAWLPNSLPDLCGQLTLMGFYRTQTFID